MFQTFRTSLAVIAMVGLVLPTNLLGAKPKQTAAKEIKPRVVDVSLTTASELTGAVVNVQGQPKANTKIEIARQGKTVEVIRTNKQGQFRFAGLRAGTYSITTDAGVCSCRVWTSQAAPPKAAKSLLVVDGASVLRGQRPICELFQCDPLLMATIVAAAIAIPIAIHKSRDDVPSGS